MCKKESPIRAAHTCKRRFLLPRPLRPLSLIAHPRPAGIGLGAGSTTWETRLPARTDTLKAVLHGRYKQPGTGCANRLTSLRKGAQEASESRWHYGTGTQRERRSSPGRGRGGARRAKGKAATKDRGMKRHHSVSQRGGYPQFWAGHFPISETVPHTAGYLPSLTPPPGRGGSTPVIMITNAMPCAFPNVPGSGGEAIAHDREARELRGTDLWLEQG